MQELCIFERDVTVKCTVSTKLFIICWHFVKFLNNRMRKVTEIFNQFTEIRKVISQMKVNKCPAPSNRSVNKIYFSVNND